MNIGDRIKKAREDKSFTRKDFAEKLQIDQSQYGKIENGKLNPTLLQVIKICSILDLSIDYIVLGKEPIISTGNIDYKAGYEMALKNIELQNEIIALKDRISSLEKMQIKRNYDIGSEAQPHSNVAESKSKLD